MRYLSTDEAAVRLGVSPQHLRRLARAGQVPGAVRIGSDGSAWRFDPAALFPLETTAPHDADASRGVSADPVGIGDDVTSSWRADEIDPAALLTTARSVGAALSSVHTRSSLALTDALYSVAAAAARHYADRDGACTACGWTAPCPDARAARDLITHAAALVLDGAR